MTPPTENSLRIFLDATLAEIEECKNQRHIYDSHSDDVNSVIQDGCSLLSRSAGLRFVVAGFSSEPWPVDVETDLASVLEQLPGAIGALREVRESIIDFYEQGVERTLVMSDESPLVAVVCLSRHATWRARPSRIFVERNELISMLDRLGADFCDLLEKACGELAKHPWLLAWRRSLSV